MGRNWGPFPRLAGLPRSVVGARACGVADRCLQLRGGIGLTLELPIEKFWRDQRSFMIIEGPTDVLRAVLFRRLQREFA